jgi:hypothetical protein
VRRAPEKSNLQLTQFQIRWLYKSGASPLFAATPFNLSVANPGTGLRNWPFSLRFCALPNNQNPKEAPYVGET